MKNNQASESILPSNNGSRLRASASLDLDMEAENIAAEDGNIIEEEISKGNLAVGLASKGTKRIGKENIPMLGSRSKQMDLVVADRVETQRSGLRNGLGRET